MLCSHLPISHIPGHMVFLLPLCWHRCLSDSTASQLTGRKFTQQKKSKYFSTGSLVVWVFFHFGLLYASGCSSGVYKARWDISGSSPVDCSAAKPGGGYPGNLALKGIHWGVKLLCYSLRVSTFLSRDLPHHEPCHAASCRVISVGKADISQIWQWQSCSQIQTLWPCWQRVPMETVSVPCKKQTFAMSYYIELRCSSFFSTVRCDLSNSMMWGLLTKVECWFSDYTVTEMTLLFYTLSLLQDQIHPLPCLLLLIPFYC